MFRFTLTYSGEDTEVCEPRGWSEFNSEIKRDFKSHGVIFRYTSGTLKLGFADGRDILENAFQQDGYDAVVGLTVDQRATEQDTWTTVYTGNAVMKNREYTENYFEVDFETSTFQQKVINRLRTKLKLDTTKDLDGNTLTGSLEENTADWNTMRIYKTYKAELREDGLGVDNYTNVYEEAGTPAADSVQILELDYLETIINELGTNVAVTSGLKDATYTGHNFALGKTGALLFTYSFSCSIGYTITLKDDAGADTFLTAELILRHEQADTTLISETVLGTRTSVTASSPASGTLAVLLDGEHSIAHVNEGELLYYYLRITGDGTNNLTSVYRNETDLDVDVDGFSFASYAVLVASVTKSVKSSPLFDVINRALYIVSGSNNRLQSNLLGRTENGNAYDGCGALTVLTNGYKLRGITNPLNTSLEELLNTVCAIWGAGWGFEKNGSTYDLRIELLEYFYGDGEILDLGSPEVIKEGDSYRESIYTELMLNRVNIGYSKYSDDEDVSNSIKDFHTEAEYSLPVSTVEGDYSKISNIIASGRLIQATFEQVDSTKNWKHDNDLFIVAVDRSGTDLIPENNEAFESINGVPDVNTVYNVRFAPVYMFLNHALIVNSALFGKDLAEEIQNTSIEINKDFDALFIDYETCLLGDPQRLTRSAGGNIEIIDNYEGLRLFKPVQHTLKVAMTSTQLDTIIDALENNADDASINYGYLTYRDDEGNIQTGYPLTIMWNPNDEIAEVTTLERADNYGV